MPYRIAGKFGGGKAWRIGHLEILARKSLANVDDLLDGTRVWWDLIGEWLIILPNLPNSPNFSPTTLSRYTVLPQLIATLNNYAYSLPSLANVDWSAFQSAFCWPCKSMNGEMVPMEGSRCGSGDLIWLPLSVHICLGLVLEYWSFVGTCTHHSYSRLYYLCHLAYLFKLLPPPTPPPCPSHPPPYVHWPNINEFHEKIHQKLVKTSHYLLAWLVVQKLIDN